MDERLWRAILNCETTFDGQYVYGVVTTGIFCRPSCRSRAPKPDNVRIFRSGGEARDAGFRACKRCRPDGRPCGPDEALVQGAMTILDERYADPLTLDALAMELAVSPGHLHRVFKRVTGVTPADHLRTRRIQAAKEALRSGLRPTATDIALAVGFRSLSYFSTVFKQATGCSPSAYQAVHANNDMGREVAT